MQQIDFMYLVNVWFDLFSPWRRNSVSFYIDKNCDLKLPYDVDMFNFAAPETDEVAVRVLTQFPSDEFTAWLKENTSGMKISHLFTVEYDVSPSGMVNFDTGSFRAASWNPVVV